MIILLFILANLAKRSQIYHVNRAVISTNRESIHVVRHKFYCTDAALIFVKNTEAWLFHSDVPEPDCCIVGSTCHYVAVIFENIEALQLKLMVRVFD